MNVLKSFSKNASSSVQLCFNGCTVSTEKIIQIKKTVIMFDRCTGKIVIPWFNKEAEITVWAYKNTYSENASGQTNCDISVILLSCGNRF